MPKVKGPLFSFDAWGTLGKAISFRRQLFGHQVEKKPRKRDLKSAAQLAQRAKFLEGCAAWHELSDEEKAEYNVMGHLHKMTGFNYFLMEWLLEAIVADEKVKVSSDDTTARYLLEKLLAGEGVSFEEVDPGGDEQLRILADTPSKIEDADGDTVFDTEESGDEDIARIRAPGSLRFKVGAGPTERFVLQDSAPHLTLTGRVKITGESAIGGVEPGANKILQVQTHPTPSTAYLRAIMGSPTAWIPNGGSAGVVRGLEFTAGVGGGGVGTTLPEISAVYAKPAITFYTGTVTAAYGVNIPPPSLMGGNPSVATFRAFYSAASASNKIVDALGLEIDDFLNNTGVTRLLELGPSTPYFRVVGGGDPAAGDANVFIKVGANLMQIYKDVNDFLKVK